MRGIVKGLDLLNCLFSANQENTIFARRVYLKVSNARQTSVTLKNACGGMDSTSFGIVIPRGETHKPIEKSLLKLLCVTLNNSC